VIGAEDPAERHRRNAGDTQIVSALKSRIMYFQKKRW
jgi:hypothetical protein